MVEDKPGNSNEGFARIEPASISLTTNSPETTATKSLRSLKHSPLIWLGLGVLLSSALVVIFLLPRWVKSPATANPAATAVAAADVSTSTQGASPTPAAKDKISPWEKAQESRLRKETQDILSQMLEAEKALSERGVKIWAGEDYAEAMNYARAGDERYNERDFVNSRLEYEKALTIFSTLVEEMDVIYKETMAKGEQALVDGNSKAAIEAFDLALAMDAIDRAAISGRERAEKLDDVLALMNTADDLLEQGKLEQAKQTYQQVLALDEHYELAGKQVILCDEKILDRNFNQHMSSGFTAMDNGRFSQARTAFNQALKLKPGSADARAALEQTSHKLTTININSLLGEAKELEERERWHEALEKYRAALKLDNSLAEAQQGEHLASLRSKLHDRLEQILAQPQRLYDAEVYDETVDFEKKLRALPRPGPVLRKQLDSLAGFLDKANTPVEVSLQSDMHTEVTLRKVAELGKFHEKTVSLRPGKYVLVGVRAGYRDVRIEFSVIPDKTPKLIIVQAAEKIAFGN